MSCGIIALRTSISTF